MLDVNENQKKSIKIQRKSNEEPGGAKRSGGAKRCNPGGDHVTWGRAARGSVIGGGLQREGFLFRNKKMTMKIWLSINLDKTIYNMVWCPCIIIIMKVY